MGKRKTIPRGKVKVVSHSAFLCRGPEQGQVLRLLTCLHALIEARASPLSLVMDAAGRGSSVWAYLSSGSWGQYAKLLSP